MDTKKIAVIGASKGIGLALAQQLAELGHQVYATYANTAPVFSTKISLGNIWTFSTQRHSTYQKYSMVWSTAQGQFPSSPLTVSVLLIFRPTTNFKFSEPFNASKQPCPHSKKASKRLSFFSQLWQFNKDCLSIAWFLPQKEPSKDSRGHSQPNSPQKFASMPLLHP